MRVNLFFIIAAIIFVICFSLFLYRIEKQVAPEVSNLKYEKEVIDNNKRRECLEIKTPEKTDQ
jgi:hypothetical protein